MVQKQTQKGAPGLNDSMKINVGHTHFDCGWESEYQSLVKGPCSGISSYFIQLVFSEGRKGGLLMNSFPEPLSSRYLIPCTGGDVNHQIKKVIQACALACI